MLEGRPGEDSGRRPALRTPGSQTPAPGTVRNESGLRPPGSWAATKGELCPLGPGRQDAGLCGPCSPSDARPGKAEGKGSATCLAPRPSVPYEMRNTHVFTQNSSFPARPLFAHLGNGTM